MVNRRKFRAAIEASVGAAGHIPEPYDCLQAVADLTWRDGKWCVDEVRAKREGRDRIVIITLDGNGQVKDRFDVAKDAAYQREAARQRAALWFPSK